MKLSIVVVCYNMQRELPRTLASLQRDYQRDVDALDYEVIVIDNGSVEPMSPGQIADHGPEFSYVYLENPPPSPAFALNRGVELATGDIVCLMVDGATLLSPGVLDRVRRSVAEQLAPYDDGDAARIPMPAVIVGATKA